MRLCPIVLAVTLGIAPGARGQGLDSSVLEGTVRDASGSVLQSARVTLTRGGGLRVVETDERGVYRFVALMPGSYTLRAELPGFAPSARDGIELRVATTATVDLVLDPGPVTERIQVTAHGFVIDVRSSSIVTTLDERLLQALPMSGSLPGVIGLAPGAFSPVTNRDRVVGFGGTIGSNGLYLDGIDITEPRRHGAWLPVNYNWLDQMQIAGPGAGAEYGEFTGAVGKAVLRSGGDRVAALGDYRTTREAWQGRNGPSLSGRELLEWVDASGQAGGPIRRDALWFFVGAERFHHDDRPRGYQGEAVRTERTTRTVLKLTHAMPTDARVEGHIQRNWSATRGANAGPNTAPDALNRIAQSDTSWNLRVARSFGSRVLLEARHGGYASGWRDDPLPPRTRDDPPPIVDGNLLRGNSNVYQDHRPRRMETEFRLSRYIPRGFGGSHDLQFGISHARSGSMTATGHPGGQRLFASQGVVESVAVWSGDRTEATGIRTAVYLQDRWQVGERLTVNAGVRGDVNRGAVPAGTVVATNPFSPRLGATWSLGRSHDAAVKAHFGRYYDSLLTERVAFMDVPGIGTTVGYLASPSGELIEVFRSAPPGARAVDPHLRHSYVDQYLLGVERRFYGEALIQAHVIRRHYEDFMAMTDTGSRWTPIELQDPGLDGVAGNGDDGPLFTAFRQENPGEQYLFYTNPSDAFRRYTALQVVLARRWSGRWQLQASYTLSSTTATVGNGDFTNAGLNDTGEQTGSRTPSAFMNPNAAINAKGRAIFDKNEFKVLGLYRVPVLAGVNLSGVLWRQGGSRWERQFIYRNILVPGNFQTIRLEPRGSRVTDPVWNLDLRLEPTLRLPLGGGAVGLAFDIFNATNQGTPLLVDPVAGASFGAPVTRSIPRTLRLLVRWRR